MKARIKNLEDFPDYLKCCPKTIEVITEFQGMLLTTIGKPQTYTDTCPYCSSSFTAPGYRSVELPSHFIPVDAIDIDESGE